MNTPPDPRFLVQSGERALHRGDVEAAAVLLARGLAAVDGQAAVWIANGWFNLGYAHRAARRFEAALDAYDRAIAAGMPGPEDAHINRAAILSDHLEQPDAARAALAAALRAAPGHPVAMLNLAILHEDEGDRDGAAALYRAMLRADPSHPTALSRLAAIDVAAGRAQATIAGLKAALDRPGWAPDDAAELAFALANALDALGHYDEALAAARRANDLATRTAAARANPYDPDAADRMIDEVMRAFPLPVASPPTDGPAMIFLCGMFRSGSTLAERIVAAHPAVRGGGEMEALPAIVAALDGYPRTLTGAELAQCRDTYLAEVRARFPGAAHVTDKRPDNFLHVGLIAAMLPSATILHTRRHPLDTLISAFFLNFQASVGYAQRLDHAAHWYRGYRRLMAHWHASMPGRVHDVEYERIVTEPEPTIRAMLDACGLPFDPACLDHRRAAGAIRTASVWQVRQPLHTRSIGRWRHYREALTGLDTLLDD